MTSPRTLQLTTGCPCSPGIFAPCCRKEDQHKSHNTACSKSYLPINHFETVNVQQSPRNARAIPPVLFATLEMIFIGSAPAGLPSGRPAQPEIAWKSGLDGPRISMMGRLRRDIRHLFQTAQFGGENTPEAFLKASRRNPIQFAPYERIIQYE